MELIRFGPCDHHKKPKKIAINLLEKYKPDINLNDYKLIFEEFDKDDIDNKKEIEKLKLLVQAKNAKS